MKGYKAMSLKIRGKSDEDLKAIKGALAKYAASHPRARIELYRHGSVAIRIRVIDPDFTGVHKAERHDQLWHFLEELPEEVLSQLSVLLLLTPEEKKTSHGSLEFDHPVSSEL
jgi:hypothetical protein